MKKYFIAIILMFPSFWPSPLLAAAPPAFAAPAGLSLAEIKITGNEFIMLQNNTGATITDLSKYWLYVFNNVNPLASGVNSSTQQLPPATLASGQTILLSAGGSTCGAAVTAKLSLSLNDSGGFLEVVQTSLSGGVLVQTSGDAVNWSSGVNNAVGMITNVPSNTLAPNNAYYRYFLEPSYLWQKADQDTNNPCQLNVTISGVAVPGSLNPGNSLLPGDPPPVTFIVDDSSDVSSLPAADIGLAAPQINELLPNPAEPQSDNEDEYVELYNSNEASFDLSGFKLQTGTSTLHTYTFAAGTTLPPKAFVAFYSIDTNLSLSNGGSQVRLLDPSGDIISQTDMYTNAPEGQAWALANDKWYWTTSVTPAAANIINQPLVIEPYSLPASASAASAKKTSTSKTSSTKTTKSSGTVKGASTTSGTAVPAPKKTSVLHPLVLAGVGIGALGYGVYEYRNDLANRFYQLRRYRASRKTAR